MMSNFMPPLIPKLDGYYDHLSMMMENLLRSKEYWSVVEKEFLQQHRRSSFIRINKGVGDLKIEDLKAKNYLFQAINRPTLETIMKKDTTKDILDSLRQKYQGTTRVKRVQLQDLRKE